MFNPVTFLVLQLRRVLLDGLQPDWVGLALYTAVAWIVASVSLLFFRYARKSFADVL
jgi:lipopolysaccharide transport system permease protein